MVDLTPVPLGTDVQVNTTTDGSQTYPALAALPGGGFVVTWVSNARDQDGSLTGIYGQRYDGAGAPVGGEFRVNTYTRDAQLFPSVAATEGGGFVVTWTSVGQDGSRLGVYGQLYDGTGAPLGPEFRVNTTTVGEQSRSSVTSLAGGGFVVTWMTNSRGDGEYDDPYAHGVVGQLYDATGKPVAGEFEVSPPSNVDATVSTVAALATGGFLVTFSRYASDGSATNVFGQRYDASGARAGGPFQVNTYTAAEQLASSAAGLANGDFVVTWTSDQDGDLFGGYAQRYDASGARIGGEFRVNSTTADLQFASSVTSLSDGGFLVGWTSYGQDGSFTGVYGQRYDAAGLAVGSEFRLNAVTAGLQMVEFDSAADVLVQLEDGSIIATWAGRGDDEVFFRRFSLPTPNTPPAGSEGRIVLDEDTRHVFAAADFGFTDADAGDVLAAVRIDTLPAAGALAFDGIPVAQGQVIATADLGKLVFTPDADANGQDFASLTFSVFDGAAFDPTPNRLTFDVMPVNDAPVVAKPIPHQYSPEDTTWTFTVPADTFFDADGDALTYSAALPSGWSLPSSITFDPATRTFTGTPTSNANGYWILEVTASDGTGSVTSRFNWNFTPVNDPPTVRTPIPDQSVDEDTAWVFQLPSRTFSDPDNRSLILSATLADGSALPSWLHFDPGTEVFSGTPPANFNGRLDLEVTGSDGEFSVSDTFTLTINPVDDAPVVAKPISHQYSPEDTPWTFTVPADTFLDVDGDALTYSATLASGRPLPGSVTFDPVTRTFSGMPPADMNGYWILDVTASDGTTSVTARFNWNLTIVNDPPDFRTPIPDQSIDEDTPWLYRLRGIFDDGPFLSLSASLADGSALPSWLAFDPYEKRFSGTPPTNLNGTLDIEVTAFDGAFTRSDTFRLTINAVDDAPVVANAIPDQLSSEDAPWVFQIPPGTFADIDSASLTCAATLGDGSALPAWLDFDPGTATFSGTPPQDFVGQIVLKVTASDGTSVASDDFTLFVLPVNDLPTVVSPIEDQVTSEDTPWTFQVPIGTFADVDGNALTLSATLADGSALPGWLTFNPVSRVFSGTSPADFNGGLSLKVTASDGPTSVSDTFDLTIAPVNDAPVVAQPVADQLTQEDAVWTFTVPAGTFTDVESAALSYAATLGDGSALPAWLTFDAGSRTFSGTPPANFVGQITLEVTASDGLLEESDTFTLVVLPVNDPPTVASPIDDQVTREDAPWAFQVPLGTFVDIDPDPLTLSATLADGSPLPSWLRFNPVSRLFSGTPPTDFNGVIELKVTASDGPSSVSDTFTLTVQSGNDAPTAVNDLVAIVENETKEASVLTNDGDIDPGQTLTVIAVTGPGGAGIVGQEVFGKYGSLTLQADGSYSYAAKNTTLPEGQTASETFTYTVSDGHGGTASADIVVTVTGGKALPPGDGQVRGTIAPSFAAEATGDFDGNGTLDVMWRNTTTNAVELWTTATDGAVARTSLGTVGANWVVEAIGNLDGKDGDDIVFRDSVTGATGAWIMRNGGQPSDWRALGTLDAKIDIAGAGDFDRDGTDDLLLVNGSTGEVEVFLQTATGPGARTAVGSLPAGWAVAGIGDLDANGTDDVLLFNATTRALGAWQMASGKIGGWYDYGTLAAGWEVTKLGDFSGTGPDDIGFYNPTTGADGAWVMSPGRPGDWLAKPVHDDLDPIGTGRIGSTTDEILWHNPVTGAVVTF